MAPASKRKTNQHDKVVTKWKNKSRKGVPIQQWIRTTIKDGDFKTEYFSEKPSD